VAFQECTSLSRDVVFTAISQASTSPHRTAPYIARYSRARHVVPVNPEVVMTEMTGAPSPLAVELRGITKRFPGVIANRDVNLRVPRGTVHAIVGENGAGKSTLMKILYGMQRPDEGSVLIDEVEVTMKSPTTGMPPVT
jgi:ABC-type bacteriocin/lantibiotic exporter with double-glycine peptidase domain